MRVLVVDDNDLKRRDVLRALREEFAGELDLSLHEAVDYDGALNQLRNDFFDLVILDLLLPGAGHAPSKETSKALIITLLRGDTLIPPTNIIGLTGFPESAEAERAFYDEHLLALEIYDPVDTVWSKRLCSRIRYLVAAKRAATSFRMNSYDYDVVVLAARHRNEFRPIRKRLFHRILAESLPLWTGPVVIGEIAGPGGRLLRGALICVGEMGMAPTAAVATEAISLLRPKLIAMVGMCCGFHTKQCGTPQRLPDAIVVREVACWEEGKYIDPEDETDPEFRNRAVTRLASESIRNEVQFIIESVDDTLGKRMAKIAKQQAYQTLIEKFQPDEVRDVPEVRFGTLVSGSSVVADEGMITEILNRHPSAIGLDMEIYGLYAAVERSSGAKPACLAVKAVADFGRSDKGAHAQEVATAVATEVFKGIVENLGIF